MSARDRAAEYAATAEAWRAFCEGATATKDPGGSPIAVVLLSALCEPVGCSYVLTGDVIADVLGGLRGFVSRVEAEAAKGGGGGLFVERSAIEAWIRRLDALIVLREYERGIAAKSCAP